MIKNILKVCMWCVGVLVFFVVVANVWIIGSTWSRVTQTAPKSVTQWLVLWASVYRDGRLSPALQQRVDASLLAYNQRKIEKLIVSGYDKNDAYHEAMSMWEYLLSRSVDDKDIFIDSDGYDTLASMQGVSEHIEWNQILVFTQRYHLYRSLFLAKHSGLEARGSPTDQHSFSLKDFGTMREIWARVKAFVEVFLLP